MNPNAKHVQKSRYSQSEVIFTRTTPRSGRYNSTESEFTVEDYRTALRLLVGAALEGTDELRLRLEPWWADVQEWERQNSASIIELDRRQGNTLLYSLLGILFKTPDYLGRGVSTASRLSSRVASIVSRVTRPVTHSRVMRPVQRRYNYYVARGESAVGSLKAVGRSEARTSRALVRQQVDEDTIEEILAYLVEKAKIRDLLAEQGVEAATDASTEIRVRSAAVDSSLDNIIDNILRRQKLQKPTSG
jgi:hypothetical protein